MSTFQKETDAEKYIDLTDIDVFQQQYNENFRRLKYFGMQYLPDEDAVLDLIQDLWLKIWERKTVLISQSAFRSYLYQALYRSILNYLKHDAIVKEYAEKSPDDIEEQEKAQEATHKIIEAEIYQALNKVFDELPSACRRVYTASLEGKSQKEIAEEFAISINTVKKHINNANHYMKDRLKDFWHFLLLLQCHP